MKKHRNVRLCPAMRDKSVVKGYKQHPQRNDRCVAFDAQGIDGLGLMGETKRDDAFRKQV